MRVALIAPPYTGYRVGESLSIRYLTSFLKGKGVECFCCDCPILEWNEKKISEFLLNRKFHLVGFSIQFSQILETSIPLIKKIRKLLPNAHIVLGGHYPSFAADKILKFLPEIDSVICGDGEYPLLYLSRALELNKYLSDVPGLYLRGMKRPNVGLAFNDIDEIPFPYREDLLSSSSSSTISMLSSRGCPCNCTFCSIPSFNKLNKCKVWRSRKPINIVNEIIEVRKYLGLVKSISFIDDNFLGSSAAGKARAERIADLLISHDLCVPWTIESRPTDIDRSLFYKLYNAGLRHVNLGVESGDDTFLKSIHKGFNTSSSSKAIAILEEIGISILPHCLLFHPLSTWESIKNTIDYYYDIGYLTFASLTSKWTPYEGTDDFYKFLLKSIIYPSGIFTYSWNHKDVKIINLWNIINTLSPLFEAIEEELGELRFQCDIADNKNISLLYRIREEYNKTLYSLIKILLSGVQLSGCSNINSYNFKTNKVSLYQDFKGLSGWLHLQCKKVAC